MPPGKVTREHQPPVYDTASPELENKINRCFCDSGHSHILILVVSMSLQNPGDSLGVY